MYDKLHAKSSLTILSLDILQIDIHNPRKCFEKFYNVDMCQVKRNF